MIKLCKNLNQVNGVVFFQAASPAQQKRQTKRAPDVWDSAVLSSISLTSGFSAPKQNLRSPIAELAKEKQTGRVKYRHENTTN